MPLESIGNEQINIHDLTIEEEKKPTSEWLEQYESLKETELYDAERKQWNYYMSEKQILQFPGRYSEVQHLDILVKLQFNDSSALKQYETLKGSLLYDKIRNQWFEHTDKNQTQGWSDRNTDAQLTGILVEAQFDKKSAKNQYDVLRKTPLYDAINEQWSVNMDGNQILKDSTRMSSNQLLSVLVEAQFDKKSALKQYMKLKNTPLYDERGKRWYWSMEENQKLKSRSYYANAQLIGILVESQFDRKLAQNLYEALKETQLYDSKRKQWNEYMWWDGEAGLLNRYAENQLLGILCEKEFEEPNLNTTPPLPEERNY